MGGNTDGSQGSVTENTAQRRAVRGAECCMIQMPQAALQNVQPSSEYDSKLRCLCLKKMATGEILNIAFGIEAKYRFPAAGAKIEFDEQTVCKHIDIVQFTAASSIVTHIHEGSLNDESHSSWVDRVGSDTLS
jgi:hypothetical protein